MAFTSPATLYEAVTVREVLGLDLMKGARVCAGEDGLDQRVEWCHAVDIPQVTEWVKPGELLLTTGYSWPEEELQLMALIQAFCDIGVVGVVLAVPGYLAGFPPAALERADQAGLPLIEFPWSIPFADVNQAVHREITSRQLRALERLDHIHRDLTEAALSARSLGDIVTRMEGLLGRSAAFVDIGGVHLAGSGGFDVDAGHGILVRTADATFGNLYLGPSSLVLTDVDSRALELAATVCALHILRQRALSEAEARVQASFVDALLQGQFGLAEGLQERARLLGYSQTGTYRVLIAALIGPEGSRWTLSEPADVLKREQVARAIRWTLAENAQSVWVTFDLNQVIALIPDLPAPRLNALMNGVAAACERFAAGHPVALGLGTAQRGSDGPPQSLREARVAVMSVRTAGVWRFEDRLVERVLATANVEAVQALEDQVFGALATWPELRATLITWAERGFSIEATSQHLDLHRNAVRHRLQRASTITGLNFDDHRVRLCLGLASCAQTIKG